MNTEERALWDRVVADYLDSPHGKEIFSAIIVSNAGKGTTERAKLAVEGAVSVGAAIADCAVAERRKREMAEPVNNWRNAKFQIVVAACCYCDTPNVRVYRRGNVYFGCESCTGLVPQEADARRVAFEEVQAILVKDKTWEERVRLVLTLVTAYLTRPE
jgi:3'-phosphoadenosine 5'-phosphosulfate sulfotransferase (PAPS reductase)/FAD synthetase